MDAKEGVARIAKLISALGWIFILVFWLMAVVGVLDGYPDWGLFFALLLAGAAVFAVIQGVVWIIDGFIGNRGNTNNFLWPYKRNHGKAKKITDESKALAKYDKNVQLTGVHGWLLWLVIVLMVMTPLVGLGYVSINLDEALRAAPWLSDLPGWENYKSSLWTLGWLVSALSFFAGYRLLKYHDPYSVKIAIAVVWLTPLLAVVADTYLVIYFFNVSVFDAVTVDTFKGLFQGILFAIVWTLYLKLSRRVKNTYYAGNSYKQVAEPMRSEPTL